MVEVEPARILPRRAIEIPGQRDLGVRLHRQSGEAGHRVGDDLVDRLRLVDDPIDKGGVCAVFEQPPHQIGKQVFVAADRSIDPARPIHPLRPDDLFVESLAHPVQTLELVVPARAGELEDRRHRVGVMAGELWIEDRPVRQQPTRAGEVGDVGRDLAGIDRVAVEPALLGMFDLAVPIGALDQPQHQSPTTPLGQISQPFDQRKSSLLVGLYGETEPVPAGKIGGERQRLDEIER